MEKRLREVCGAICKVYMKQQNIHEYDSYTEEICIKFNDFTVNFFKNSFPLHLKESEKILSLDGN